MTLRHLLARLVARFRRRPEPPPAQWTLVGGLPSRPLTVDEVEQYQAEVNAEAAARRAGTGVRWLQPRPPKW